MYFIPSSWCVVVVTLSILFLLHPTSRFMYYMLQCWGHSWQVWLAKLGKLTLYPISRFMYVHVLYVAVLGAFMAGVASQAGKADSLSNIQIYVCTCTICCSVVGIHGRCG